MVRREPVVAGLLALLAAGLVYTIATVVFPYHTTNHDEAVYLQQAAMLLEGTLFLTPPVPEAFRPWFFVEAGDSFYPKYAPVPAAMFAAGELFGGYQLSLAGIAAANVVLAYGVVAEIFDRRTGVLASVFLILSPLFLVDSAVFLPYAPTTTWNLLFAFAYLRADRTGDRAWAAVAGIAVGIAFVSRPYTALLFAAPLVAHALWTLRGRDRTIVTRHGLTAALGLAGVGVALAYNTTVTGSPLLFPYEAFAPADGLGFGRREIMGYERMYSPALAIRANAQAVALFLSRWMTAGLVGSALAALGIGITLSRMRDEIDPRRAILVGVVASIAVGNIYFWGTLNVLGTLDDPTDGLVPFLGTYYHFDLLIPMAAFAAHGALTMHDRWQQVVNRQSLQRAGIIALAGTVVGAALFGGAASVAVTDPIQKNRAVTEQLRGAYEPIEARDLSYALVFLPTPYGNWLNHPFQALRNDPNYDGQTVYAIDEEQFAVVDAFPDRAVYRYVYRGAWAPYAGSPVEARLQPVRKVSGEHVTAITTIGVPNDTSDASIRLSTDGDTAYYTVNGTPDRLTFRLHIAGERAWITGPIAAVGDAAVSVGSTDEIVVDTFVDFGGGSGLTYRLALPVDTDPGMVRALTPSLEACRNPQRCGGEAAFIPNQPRPGVFIDAELRQSMNQNRAENGTIRRDTGR